MEKVLYIVSTPIGNLRDITLRALEILKEVDIIACENPLHHSKLLNHHGIKGKKLIKITSANEENSVKGIINLLERGKKVAFVSDAGTPNLSDPGGKIVRELQKYGVRCIPIPGVSALTTAISVSPIPVSKFIFYGFPPKSIKKTEKIIENLKPLELPIVFFIPSNHIKEFLEMLCRKFPSSEIAIFRELTKINEEILYGPPCKLQIEEKGEIVLILKL